MVDLVVAKADQAVAVAKAEWEWDHLQDKASNRQVIIQSTSGKYFPRCQSAKWNDKKGDCGFHRNVIVKLGWDLVEELLCMFQTEVVTSDRNILSGRLCP